MAPPPWFPATVVSTRTLAPAVRELTFARQDGPLVYAPGQWVNLELDTPAGPVVRAYSIASPPDGSGTFALAITRVDGGPASTALHGLRTGATLRAQGPQGFFTRAPAAGHPCLFVGTGTGVTPLRSMLLAELATDATDPLQLLLGVRHEDDLLYRGELEHLARTHARFSFGTTLSQPDGAWTGRRGYVQSHVPELLAPLGDAAHVYVCGLERMVKAVREVVRKQLGLPRERVHSERYD